MKTAIIGLAFLGALCLPAMADDAVCPGPTLAGDKTEFTAKGWDFEVLTPEQAAPVLSYFSAPASAGVKQVAVAGKDGEPVWAVGFFDAGGCEIHAAQITPGELAAIFSGNVAKPSTQNGHVGKFDYDPKRDQA